MTKPRTQDEIGVDILMSASEFAVSKTRIRLDQGLHMSALRKYLKHLGTQGFIGEVEEGMWQTTARGRAFVAAQGVG
jgi:predicted transcriptional regulator